MKILDCHTLDSTLSTLSTITGIETDQLVSRLRSFPGDKFLGDPPAYLWQEIVGKPKEFDGAYWFHLTRTMTPESFKQLGILPLNHVLDTIWATVFDLIGERMTLDQKRHFKENMKGQDADAVRLKLSSPIHNGPYGMLVRESAFRSLDMNNHDYLSAPELIGDICRCYSQQHSCNLIGEFYSKSKPCIIKFLGDNTRRDAPPVALLHAWGALHGQAPHNTCFNGRGAAIAPSQIIDVEIVSPEKAEAAMIAFFDRHLKKQ